jgi:HD-GYP domain-containing protein (c-di-GMP phosphodiesterase class II)
LQQVVDGLLALVDRRDPHAADHSERVAVLAAGIAKEMDLDAVTAETARFAGALMNVGKIMVPESILAKPGRLTDAELEQVREALARGADLLDGIEFDGPVAETLRQAHGRADRTGSGKRTADDILPSARVVAAANAFVAMISPRAHRPGMTVDEALDALNAESGAALDRRVLAALANYLDNRGGRAALTGGA